MTLVLVRDLLLASQIRMAAQHASPPRPITLLRDPKQLETVPEEAGGSLILDCNLEGALQAVAAYKSRTGHKLIGFVSHTDAQTISQARSAGVDTLLARSAFFKDPAAYLLD